MHLEAGKLRRGARDKEEGEGDGVRSKQERSILVRKIKMSSLKRRCSCAGKKADRNLYRGIRVVSLRSFVRCQTNLAPGAISTRMPSPFPLLVRSWLAHIIAKRLLYPSHSQGPRGAPRNAYNCSAKLSVLSKIGSFARNERAGKTYNRALLNWLFLPVSSVSIAVRDRSAGDLSWLKFAHYELTVRPSPSLFPRSRA